MTEKQQQIVQMAKDICRVTHICNDVCNPISACDALKYAERAIEAGYSKQSVGEWEWFEEWNPSTPEHPRECDDCGWRCGECKTALSDIVGGYWDDPDEKPNLNFCPNCGAKMKGGE